MRTHTQPLFLRFTNRSYSGQQLLHQNGNGPGRLRYSGGISTKGNNIGLIDLMVEIFHIDE
jgi:hypothetical protein